MEYERRIAERAYFLLRAESELRQARSASCDEAAKAHFRIAGAYFDKVHRLLVLDDLHPAPGTAA